MTDHWQVIEDVLKKAYYAAWRSQDDNRAATLAGLDAALAFVREKGMPADVRDYLTRLVLAQENKMKYLVSRDFEESSLAFEICHKALEWLDALPLSTSDTP